MQLEPRSMQQGYAISILSWCKHDAMQWVYNDYDQTASSHFRSEATLSDICQAWQILDKFWTVCLNKTHIEITQYIAQLCAAVD